MFIEPWSAGEAECWVVFRILDRLGREEALFELSGRVGRAGGASRARAAKCEDAEPRRVRISQSPQATDGGHILYPGAIPGLVCCQQGAREPQKPAPLLGPWDFESRQCQLSLTWST